MDPLKNIQWLPEEIVDLWVPQKEGFTNAECLILSGESVTLLRAIRMTD